MKLSTFALGSFRIAAPERPFNQISQEYLESKLSRAEIANADQFKHPIRRHEFLIGRLLLHALEPKLGPVLRDASGMPNWPKDFLGSISHKGGCVAAALVSAQAYRGIGIDLEIPSEMPLNVIEHVCRGDEILLLKEPKMQETLTLIFSAKESLFKCCYPTTQIWFGFHEAQFLANNEETRTFSIKLLKNLPPFFHSGQVFHGAYRHYEWGKHRFLLTGIGVPAEWRHSDFE